MTWRGEPLEHAEFQYTLPVDIRVRTYQAGVVSDYEERRVAADSNYQWDSWMKLSPQERATCIAHHRVKRMIELAANDVEFEWNRRRTGKAQG